MKDPSCRLSHPCLEARHVAIRVTAAWNCVTAVLASRISPHTRNIKLVRCNIDFSLFSQVNSLKDYRPLLRVRNGPPHHDCPGDEDPGYLRR